MKKTNLGFGWIVCLSSTTALTFACSSDPEGAPSSSEKTAAPSSALGAGVSEARPAPNRMYGAELVNGEAVSGGAWDLPASAHVEVPTYEKAAVVAYASKGVKFDDALERRVARAEGSTDLKEKDATVEVVVTFRDTLKMPYIPTLSPSES